MSAAETSLGAFRRFSGTVGMGVRTADTKPRRLQAADPANEAFEACRRAIVCTGNRPPLERVAAFLVAISRNNGHEGRDPSVIPDSLTCAGALEFLRFMPMFLRP